MCGHTHAETENIPQHAKAQPPDGIGVRCGKNRPTANNFASGNLRNINVCASLSLINCQFVRKRHAYKQIVLPSIYFTLFVYEQVNMTHLSGLKVIPFYIHRPMKTFFFINV